MEMIIVKKCFALVSIFLAVSLMLAPCAFAWKWTTHSKVVDAVYYSMPYDKKVKLNLAVMRDGSNDPDEKFHDTRCHGFPSSYTRASTWLSKGKSAYQSKNYRYASYCFGVASHYISDTYSAPHCVSGESSYYHTKYEAQATYMTPKVSYTGGSLYSIMKSGSYKGKTDWNSWMRTKSRSYVQSDLNRGTSASYMAIKNAMA